MKAPIRASRRAVLGLLGTAGAVVAVPSVAHGSVPKGLRPGGVYDRFIAERAAQDQFSGTVLVAYRDRPVLTRAYGMANKQQAIPNRPDTIFGLRSITKCFTAVAIAQLAQRGKVAFREKLGTYLDGFPADIAGTVTIHHLLTHTSGVGRPAVQTGPQQRVPGDSVEEVWDNTMALIRGLPLRFQPGTQYAYSNDGYFVLGAIVAAVSGLSYYDYVRRHVFTPARMTRSDFCTRPEILANPHIARPYETDRVSGDRVDATARPYFWFVGGPDAGAYSTASDLLRFARALWDGRLLDPVYVHLITSGKVPLPDPGAFYAYGFTDRIVNGRRITGHTGSGLGAANILDTYPDHDWVSIVLSNYDTPIDPIVQLGRHLLS